MKSIILCLALFSVIDCKQLGRCLPGSKRVQCQDNVVEVGVYFESVCPDSRAFIINQLMPTFNKLNNVNPKIMSVNLVPFGNAQITFNKNATKHPSLNFTCQHKEEECEGNIIQSCAVTHYDIEASLPYVYCMFNSSHWKTPTVSASLCSQNLSLSFNELSECIYTLDGVSAQFLMAGQTNALEPPHKYVPWITINGKHTEEINKRATTDLLKLVCDTYTGPTKPRPCKSP